MKNWDYEKDVEIIANGIPQPKQYPINMPAMGGVELPDADIRSLAAFVFSLSKGSGLQRGAETENR